MNLERQKIRQSQQELIEKNKKEYQDRMVKEKLRKAAEDKIIYNQVHKPEAVKLKIIQNYNLLSKVNSGKTVFIFVGFLSNLFQI